MSTFNVRFLVFLMVMGGFSAQAMVFDNRYFPLIQHPFITVECRPSHFAMNGFVTTASAAFGRDEEEVGLPLLFGPYDQRELARSFVKAGLPNPLRSSFLFFELPWKMAGKIQSQGFDLEYQQSFNDCLAAGFLFLVMRSDSRIDFDCDFGPSVTTDEKAELADIMRHMHDEIGLHCAHAHQVGFGDIEAYLRFGHTWDYLLKFRKIQAGIRLGMLAPTGVTHDINEPASVPFGGDGHWGAYSSLDAEFELKEDWKLGFLVRVSKRFAKTCLHRMPVCKEHPLFAPVVGLARVNPGVTAIASTYFSMENLREGFGVRVQYTWTDHTKDCWTDERPNKTVPVNLKKLEDFSDWTSSYVTLNAFYDFGKVKMCREFDPILIFAWDVPVTFFNAHDISKTNKISLGLEFNF